MTKSDTAQNFIPIKEIKDGVLILKDGSMRALLITTSLNFALKSLDEQQSIIYQFQNFLNSLDFSVQIFVQSRRLDIRPYLSILEDRQKEQVNDLMRIQIKEYMEFIKTFTENTKIMTKSFYIVIPYAPSIVQAGKSSGLLNKKGDKKALKQEDFEENKTQLEQRVSIVEQGVIRCGIRTARLGTEEMIEVFYKLFNPGDVETSFNI
jgi:type IV secretory pathway VirB4 component